MECGSGNSNYSVLLCKKLEYPIGQVTEIYHLGGIDNIYELKQIQSRWCVSHNFLQYTYLSVHMTRIFKSVE